MTLEQHFCCCCFSFSSTSNDNILMLTCMKFNEMEVYFITLMAVEFVLIGICTLIRFSYWIDHNLIKVLGIINITLKQSPPSHKFLFVCLWPKRCSLYVWHYYAFVIGLWWLFLSLSYSVSLFFFFFNGFCVPFTLYNFIVSSLSSTLLLFLQFPFDFRSIRKKNIKIHIY